MEIIYKILRVLVDIGPVGLSSLFLLFLGLIASRNKLILLRNALYTYLGLFSFSILLFFFVSFFTPIINMIISNSDKKFQAIDVGWFIASNINIYNAYTIQILAVIIGVNIIMLFLRLTRTFNIDIWNLWISLFSGLFIYGITKIYWMGILLAGVTASITFVMADIYAPYVDNYYGLKGISLPNPGSIAWAPVSSFVNFTFNKIPVIKKINIFYEEIRYKLGIVGEPLITGFTFGFIIGFITKFKELLSAFTWSDIGFCLYQGIYLSVLTILIPRALTLLYKGLIPIINDVKIFINSKITKREIYIGLNPLIIAGNPSVIALSTIMIPLSVYIATILPGNNVLPSADLVMIPILLVWAIGPSKGDIFRSFISAIIIIPLVLLISTNMSDIITQFLSQDASSQIVKGYNEVSSLGMGSNLIFWILSQILKPLIKFFS